MVFSRRFGRAQCRAAPKADQMKPKSARWFFVAFALCVLPAAAGIAQSNAMVPTPSPEAFAIAVFGDMPYINGVKDPAPILAAYRNLLDDINAHEAAFIVHLGDITNGPHCGDSVLAARYAEFESMRHPFFYVFGDNEWTDCRRGGFDPLERLAKLRATFTQGNRSLGARRMKLERQSDDPRFALYRENVRWSVGGVMFVGLNIPGSNNNWGPDSLHPSAEYVQRNAANLAWIDGSFAIAKERGMRGVAIFVQADPAFDRTILPPASLGYFTGFDDLLGTLRRNALAFDKPILFVHGDSHYFMIDKPLLADSTTGRAIANFTRAEGFGAQNIHWLRIVVDPADPNLFRFDPMLVRKNLGR